MMRLIREANNGLKYKNFRIVTHNDDSSLDPTGTARYMTIGARYDQLVSAFGEPIKGRYDDDTTAEWVINVEVPFEDQDGSDFDYVIVTIYTSQPDPRTEKEWYVGAARDKHYEDIESFQRAVGYVLHLVNSHE